MIVDDDYPSAGSISYVEMDPDFQLEKGCFTSSKLDRLKRRSKMIKIWSFLIMVMWLRGSFSYTENDQKQGILAL